MEGDFIKTNKWLLPFSWFYGLAVKTRNTLFEMGVLKSRSFQIPIISVGNITVGGTGIAPIVATDPNRKDVYTDLNGIRMNSRPNRKGIYIRNGRKEFVR